LKGRVDWNGFAEGLRRVFREAEPIEQAKAFIRGRDEYNLSNRRIADLTGCSDGHVRNMLRLLQLPLQEQSRIAAGGPYRAFLYSSGRLQAPADNLDNDTEVKEGREAIRGWCDTLELRGGYAHSAVKQADCLLTSAEVMRMVSESSVLWQGTPESVLRTFMPAGYSRLTDLNKVNAAGECIARALAYLVPNWEIRRKVLVEALMDLDPYRKR
jgi:hypothetical protein